MIVLHILFFLFAGATLFQAIYWALVPGRWLFSAARAAAPPGRQIPISVLICARNEAPQLGRFLPEVLEQRYTAPWEVIVVDDDSQDETPQVLAALQAKYPRLQTIRISPKTGPGKKRALARAVAAAQYEGLLLTDADCQPVGPDWLATMAACLDGPVELALGYAPMTPGPGLLNAWSRYETAYTALQYGAFAAAGMPYMGVGRNLALRKSLFERSGGFDRHLHIPSGDDDLLVNAVARPDNTQVCFAPESFVFSAPKTSWRGWLRQKKRHAGAAVVYRLDHRLAIGAVALTHTLHYGLAAILLAAGYSPLWIILSYLLRLLVVVSVYAQGFRMLKEKKLLLLSPFFDGLLAVYYGAVMPFLLTGKPNQADWK